MEIIDASAPIRPGMVTYPGDPAVRLERVSSIAGGEVLGLGRSCQVKPAARAGGCESRGPSRSRMSWAK